MEEKDFSKSSFLSFHKNLEEMIRARTPLLYIGSIEIKRCLKELRIIASKIAAETRVFDFSRGILEEDGEETQTDPIGALDIILKKSKKNVSQSQTLWILPFFHLLLYTPDPFIISKLRNIVEFAKFNDSVIIIGTPGFTFPNELTDVPVIDLSPPNSSDIKSSLGGNLPEDEKEKITRLCLGFSLREIEDLLSRSFARKGRIELETIEALRSEMITKKGAHLFHIEFPRENLDEVGGMEVLKEWLKLRRDVFLRSDLLKKWGLASPKGILLTGVPGCGKSLVSKAIAGSWRLPLIRLDPSKIYSPSLGSSERNLSRCLELSSTASPCVFWIDEIEKMFSITDPRTDGGVSGRLLGTFLHFLQERDSSIFVVATSNGLGSLPGEMLRKGRWDEIFFIDLPNREERQSIFEGLFKKHRLDLEMEEDFLLSSEDFSGAEIEQAVINACYEAIFRGTPVSALDVSRTLKKIIPLSYSTKEKIETLRRWGIIHAIPAGRITKNILADQKVISMELKEGRSL
jgi:AAA+ superfamily predicted ATPase